MTGHLALSIRKDVVVREHPGNRFALQSTKVNLNLELLSPGILAAFKLLCSGGAAEAELESRVLESDGPEARIKLTDLLRRLAKTGILCHSVRFEGKLLATLAPLSSSFEFRLREIDPTQPYLLSRFCYCRREAGQMVLESPLAHAWIELHDWRAGTICFELAQPRNCKELAQLISGTSLSAVQALLALLVNSRAITRVGRDDAEQEEESEALPLWEFHDLLFHSRSRLGRHAKPYGGTYRFVRSVEPLPAVKPKMSPDIIDLFVPDLTKLRESDLTLTAAIEDRRSVREQGDRPITLCQLGEFLYRLARIRSVMQTEKGELSSRPYPSGGAAYEQELYVVANECEGLPSGLYHYAAQDHQLCRLSPRNQYTERLLKLAWQGTDKLCWPQALLVITARFPRVMWKYESMAYALILKNVGVLFQTMYLVATAIGLAPCALGGGDSDLFALAAGLDYYSETSVGEFILGSRGLNSQKRLGL